MVLKELSLNDTVYFKLTKYGEKRKSEINDFFGEPENGLYRDEFWVVMYFFKDTFGWGHNIEFVFYINLNEEEL